MIVDEITKMVLKTKKNACTMSFWNDKRKKDGFKNVFFNIRTKKDNIKYIF